MKIKLTLTLTAVALASAHGAVINVDIQGGGDPRDFVGLAAHPDAEGVTAQWNISGTSGTGLIESDGTATTVGYQITSPNAGEPRTFRQNNQTGPQNNLVYDYAFDGFATAADRQLTLSINNLDAGATYDIYLYGGTQFQDNADSNTTWDLAGDQQTINWTGLDGNPDITTDFFEGENFVVFSGVTGSTSYDIISQAAGLAGEVTITGFAVVDTIPEPSSALLSLIAVGGMALRRRR